MPEGPFGGPRPLSKADLEIYLGIDRSGVSLGQKNVVTEDQAFEFQAKKREFLNKYIYKDILYLREEDARKLPAGETIGESMVVTYPGRDVVQPRIINNLGRQIDEWFGITINPDNWRITIA